MSILLIAKKLVETRLSTLSPSYPIAWEAVKFEPPADGSKYLKCNLSISKPSDPTMGDLYYRENAVFNVYVMDKLNIGTSSALTTAESIRELFKKTTTLEEGNVRVQVLSTPHASSATVAQDRLVIPVRIELTIENL